MNAGISVSRVGGSAQIKAMKGVAGPLRLELAQFRELAAFAAFGSDLDPATQRQLNRGLRLREILKQDQYVPMPVERQVVSIFAVTQGYIDQVAEAQTRKYEAELHDYIEARYPAIFTGIVEKKQIDADIKTSLTQALAEFTEQFKAANA